MRMNRVRPSLSLLPARPWRGSMPAAHPGERLAGIFQVPWAHADFWGGGHRAHAALQHKLSLARVAAPRSGQFLCRALRARRIFLWWCSVW